MKKPKATQRTKSKKVGGEKEQFVPSGSRITSLLEETEKQRYTELINNALLTEAEHDELGKLIEKVDERRHLLERLRDARSRIGRLEKALTAQPNAPALQREYLRAWIAPCYPDFDRVILSWQMQGKHPWLLHGQARSGLETVLYFMDSTIMANELKDPERRIRFLYGVHTMLEPFRKLKDGKKVDLLKAFEFKATGRGKRPKNRTDETLEDLGMPCFEVHLLLMAGIKKTPAQSRVAAVHNTERDRIRKAYNKWIKHPVRADSLRQGDDAAKDLLTAENLRALITTAYPPLPREPRAHPTR